MSWLGLSSYSLAACKGGSEGYRWEQGCVWPPLCTGMAQNKQQPVWKYSCQWEQMGIWTFITVFWGFAKRHHVRCWNWRSSEAGHSRSQSQGLQTANFPLESKGIRTKVWDSFRMGAEAQGCKPPLCESLWMRSWVKARAPHSIPTSYPDSGSRLAPLTPSYLGERVSEGQE